MEKQEKHSEDKDIFMHALAGFMVLFSCIYSTMILFIEIPEGNRELVSSFVNLWMLGGGMTVINYFYGSSHKAKNKENQK